MPKRKKREQNKSLRIAMFGQKHTFSHEGGIETVVTELICRMADKGYAVTCFDRSGRTGMDERKILQKRDSRIRIKHVLTVNSRGFAALTSSLSASICTAFGNYDIVHVHAEGPAAACWLPKLFGKRVICTIHGLDWQREKWGRFASLYIKQGERIAAKYADEVIVLNESTRQYFLREYGRETVVIPNGVTEPKKSAANLIREYWNLEQDSYVLFVGRLVPEKGLRYLLEAWKEIQTEKKLVIAGGTPASEHFLQELKELASENVFFTGFVQGAALDELYSNAYLYVLPSDLEGMPLSLMEAMSFGACCLTSDIPGCMETAEDRAFYFEHGNVEALRKSIQSLLDTPETVKNCKAKASEFILEKYSWDKTVDMTLAVYLNHWEEMT